MQSITRWSVVMAVLAVLAGLAAWLYVAPPGISGKLDAIGYAVCHRLESHSLKLAGVQMPLCARCTGEFNAAAVVLIFQAIASPRQSRLPGRGVMAILAGFFLAFAFDGTNSYLALMRNMEPGLLAGVPILYVTNNITRVLTGSGMGLALGAALYPMYNQSVWQMPGEGRALTWRKLGLLAGLLLLVDVGILTESPFVLYPVAILSVLGVVALLTMIFSIVWMMIMRQENTFNNLRQLWLPAGAGLTMSLVLIIGIDVVRFSLTRTWEGFPGLKG